jgi:hypothetical protein
MTVPGGRRIAFALLAWAGVLVWSRVSGADPHVVIVEASDSPALPALPAQVTLHAGRPVTVTTARQRGESSTTLAARASQIVVERDATIVVWVATLSQTDGARSFLVFAAGRWPGRALIELVRFDAATGAADVERTIALKIAGLLDSVTAPRPIGAALGVPVDRTRGGPRWRVDVVGGLVRELGDRAWDGRLELSVDRRLFEGPWRVAAGLGLHWQPGGTIDGSAGVVSIDEVGASLAITIERPFGAWTMFVRPRGIAPLLIAEGISRDDARGSANVVSPAVGLDVGIWWRLSDMLQVGVSVGLEAALIQQRFLVDGSVTADLDRARLRSGLGLSIVLP